MQRKKNIKLLIILGLLIIVTVFLYTIDGKKERVTTEQNLFTIADTAAIERIVIEGPDINNTLSKESGQWLVNDKFILDEGLRTVLLSVFYRVRVQRPVAAVVKNEIVNQLQQEGTQVKIYNQQGVIKSFLAGGEKDANITYFMMAGSQEPYIVHLPGYQSYVAGIFEITENDWRNRIVLAPNWHLMDSINIRYPQQPADNFTVMLENNQFVIDNIQQVDTTVMADFLDQISYIVADRFIDYGESMQYDSLIGTTPLQEIFVHELGEQNANVVRFYPRLSDSRFILGKVGEQQMALFDYNRISQLFRKKQDFRMTQQSQ